MMRLRHFLKRETYSLTDQMRRAAVSVPSNIAEGQAHYSHPEFRHFLRHSRGSLVELETKFSSLSEGTTSPSRNPLSF